MVTRKPAAFLARDRRPLYLRAVEAFHSLVHENGLQPGDRIPSEPELASLFGVARSTIREAMGHLEIVGIVERRRGVGTVLTEYAQKPAVGLEALESLERLAARQEWTCGTVDLVIRSALATEEQANRLEIEGASPVSIISRTKTRNKEPFAVMESIVPEIVVPFEVLEREFENSITEYLLGRHSPPLRYAIAEVTAAACDAERGARLGQRVGTPLLILDELFVGDGGQRLAWNVLSFVPGTIRLEVVRRPLALAPPPTPSRTMRASGRSSRRR